MREDDRGASARRRRDSRQRSSPRPANRSASVRPPRPTVAASTTAADPVAALLAHPDRAEVSRAAADGALRSALVMFIGFVATAACGLALWALTPGTDIGAEAAVRAATAAYVLAHFGHVGIDGAGLSLSPLLLPLVFGLLLAVGPGRGRPATASAVAEGASVAAGAVSYAALVVVAAVTLAPPGVAVLGAAVGAFVLAGVALGIGMLRRGGSLPALMSDRLPGWATVGLRAGCAAALTAVAGAGLVLAVGLALSFTTATDLASTLSDGAGDAIGLALAGLAYLPNAVLATVGYTTGVGFDIGPGRYSPFGSVPADLPPFPLLAAVPANTGLSVPGLVAMLVPVAAGVVAGHAVLRRVTDRRDRCAAVGVAAATAGLVIGLLVWAASGGVSGGVWPHIGAVGWRVGPVLGAIVLVVAGAWVLAAGRENGSAVTAAGGGAPVDDHDGPDDPGTQQVGSVDDAVAEDENAEDAGSEDENADDAQADDARTDEDQADEDRRRRPGRGRLGR